MVKAKDFWNYLCEELDYRFFAGVACPGLSPLYKKMDSKFMHYIPAVNEKIGLGLVSGAYMAGYKGALLMDMAFAYDITSFIRFNVNNRIPLLIIGYGNKNSALTYDFPSEFINNQIFERKIKKVATASAHEKIPGLIVIKEGILS
jgi:sulfopyruvate decarboxylase TPP-binding subunit